MDSILQPFTKPSVGTRPNIKISGQECEELFWRLIKCDCLTPLKFMCEFDKHNLPRLTYRILDDISTRENHTMLKCNFRSAQNIAAN